MIPIISSAQYSRIMVIILFYAQAYAMLLSTMTPTTITNGHIWRARSSSADTSIVVPGVTALFLRHGMTTTSTV